MELVLDMSSATRTQASPADPTIGLRTLTTSTLRSKLGEVMETLETAHECLLLMTHSKPKAVLVPYDKFIEMTAAKPQNLALEFLAANYEQLAASMDTPAARAGAKEAFDAGPEVFRSRPLRG